ncbi:SRPBCC family protein [Nitrospirota bacterium]
MATINKSIKIKAPVSKVFGFITDPENWTTYVSGLVAVNDLSKDVPAKGSTFKWDYRIMGIKLSGKGEISEMVKNKRFGLDISGRAKVNESFTFEKGDDGETILTAFIDHEFPGAAMKAVSNTKLFEKLNSNEAKNILQKIKIICEA